MLTVGTDLALDLDDEACCLLVWRIVIWDTASILSSEGRLLIACSDYMCADDKHAGVSIMQWLYQAAVSRFILCTKLSCLQQ